MIEQRHKKLPANYRNLIEAFQASARRTDLGDEIVIPGSDVRIIADILDHVPRPPGRPPTRHEFKVMAKRAIAQARLDRDVLKRQGVPADEATERVAREVKRTYQIFAK